MRYIALSSVVAVLVSSPALAADPGYALRGPIPPETSAEYEWSGLYLGVHAGMASTRSTAVEQRTLPDDPASCAPAGTAGVPAGMYWCNVNGAPNYTSTPTPAFNRVGDKWGGAARGIMSGVTVGYNMQLGQFVYGVEFDWGMMTGKGNYGPSPASRDDTMLHVRPGDYQTARLRLGYAYNRFLPYLTAGAALGRFNAWVSDPDMPIGVHSQQTRTQVGYVVGAGLEYGLTRNISVKGEYLNMGFAGQGIEGYVNVSCPGNVCPPQWKLDRLGMANDGIAAWKVRHTVNLMRLGMNYRF